MKRPFDEAFHEPRELLCLNLIIVLGQIHANVNQKICRLEIVFDRLWYPLSILLLAAIGAKLIGPHGGLRAGKDWLLTGQAYMDLPIDKTKHSVF